jgi:hypothetical protein
MSHVTRFSPDMQQLALVSAKETAGKQIYGRRGVGESQKGVAVGPDGRIYAHHMLDWNKYVISSGSRTARPTRKKSSPSAPAPRVASKSICPITFTSH